MKTQNTFVGSKETLLPLRINGVDFDFDAVTDPKLVNMYKVDQFRWTYFPTITAAASNEKPKDSSDLKIRCSNFEHLAEKAAADVDNPANRHGKGRPAPEFSWEDVPGNTVELIQEAYKRASLIAKSGDFMTPSELLLALIEMIDKENRLNLQIISGFLHLDRCEDFAQEIALNELLCRFKALVEQSVCSADNSPGQPIAISGGAMADLQEPIPYSDDDPLLDMGPSMPEDLREIKMTVPMHCMSTGGSGTGKTMNVIIPRLKAHLRYKLKDGTQSTALIVDPKRELLRVTEEYLAAQGELDRLFVAGKDGRFKLFPMNTSLSLQDRMTLLMRELGVNPDIAGDNKPWVEKSLNMAQSFAKVYAIAYNKTGRNLFNDLLHLSGKNCALSNDFWRSLRQVIKLLQGGFGNISWMNKQMIQFAKELNVTPEESVEFQFLSRYANMGHDEAPNQISYVTGGLDPLLGKICDEGLSKWLDATPVPEVVVADNDSYDLKELIDAGRILVFQPLETPSGDVGTRLLKAQFNRVTMERKNLRQPVLFLCDEFQRYISDDNESGEASFLDRCRAYRVTVVLATQSINALYDSLNKRSVRSRPEYAVSSILANVAHHFYFQTNDPATTKYLKESVPPLIQSNWPHPLNVLPLSNLCVGEAYYTGPQGKWNRVQFQLNS